MVANVPACIIWVAVSPSSHYWSLTDWLKSKSKCRTYLLYVVMFSQSVHCLNEEKCCLYRPTPFHKLFNRDNAVTIGVHYLQQQRQQTGANISHCLHLLRLR